MSDTPIPPPPAVPPPPASAPPPPSSSGPGGTESPNRKPMLVLSYLWLLALIPFLIEKDDDEVKWHAKHGLVLMGAEFVLWIVLVILQMVISQISGTLGCVMGILTMLLWLGILGLHIYCIVQAFNGQRFKINGLSDFADRF